MYIPEWLFWTAAVIAWLVATAIASKSGSGRDYDFTGVMLGALVFVIGAGVIVGLAIGRMTG